MKKTVIIILALVAFDYLFYEQLIGINVLIMDVLLILTQVILYPQVLKNRNWYWITVSSLISAITCFWYADPASLFANLFSLALLSSISSQGNVSVITAISGAAYTYVLSPFKIVKQSTGYLSGLQIKSGNLPFIKIGLVFLSLLIGIIFFFIYRESSLIFKNFTNLISFGFISVAWILFTINGLFLIVSYFYFTRPQIVYNLIDVPSSKIVLKQPKSDFYGLILSPELEFFGGCLVLILLNVLLFTVNVLDIHFLFSGKLPAGVTYTEYVHQGVGMHIISIISAISLILIIFRGNLNFYKNSFWSRFLAYAWIVQNILLLFSTLVRNTYYIESYGLTEKRIGVYIYLFLALIGLIMTSWKIYSLYSNAWLFRINSTIFYVILIVSCIVPWDGIIVKYDLSRKDAVKSIPYLTHLSSYILPEIDMFIKSKTESMIGISDDAEKQLEARITNIVKEYINNPNWQSYCYLRGKTYKYFSY